MIRALFAGGGSAGHLAPSIAVWGALREKQTNARAIFVCATSRADTAFLKNNGVKFVPITAPKGNSPLLVLLMPIAILESFFIVTIFRPHIIFAKGGYVSVPICIAGWILRIPIVLHESDRVMGRANRFLVRFAQHLCIGTPQKEIANDDVMANTGIAITATGNPIREFLTTGSRDGGRRITGFSGKKPVLLVIGGSQGSNAINTAVWNRIDELVDICDVIHLTGKGKSNPDIRHGRYMQIEFSHDELHNLYAFADIVVSRAGAGTIAELGALKKATILIPIPDLAGGHQEENAHFLQVAGAAVVLDQSSIHDTLVSTVNSLIQDSKKRHNLEKSLHGLSDSGAAGRIANILLATARR